MELRYSYTQQKGNDDAQKKKREEKNHRSANNIIVLYEETATAAAAAKTKRNEVLYEAHKKIPFRRRGEAEQHKNNDYVCLCGKDSIYLKYYRWRREKNGVIYTYVDNCK